DNGDCCFGGQPKLTDMIQVTLKDSQTLDYSPHMVKVSGTFQLRDEVALHDVGSVVYHLEDAEYKR
ncbi:MAG: hypothetical protein N2C14_10735, partial [Planctomycetales bacterium]